MNVILFERPLFIIYNIIHNFNSNPETWFDVVSDDFEDEKRWRQKIDVINVNFKKLMHLNRMQEKKLNKKYVRNKFSTMNY